MAERFHRFQTSDGVWMTSIPVKEPMGVAYDAPPDPTKSPVLLKDLAGVVHSVVKKTGDTWHYCDIDVMRDWLVQDGKNVVDDTTPITCVKCLAGGHEG